MIGFETEHMPDLIEAQDELLAPYPIDYMILGQHFLKQECDGVYTGAPTTDETTLQNYVDTVIAGLESGRYLYLAHPDLINYVGDAAIYERHMTRLCQYLLGAVDGRHYPSKRFLDIASKVQNKAIIGIDAHSPEQIKRSNVGEQMLRRMAQGITIIEQMEEV